MSEGLKYVNRLTGWKDSRFFHSNKILSMYILTKHIHKVQFFLSGAQLTKGGWSNDYSPSRRDALQFESHDDAYNLKSLCDPLLTVAPYKKLTEVKAEVEA